MELPVPAPDQRLGAAKAAAEAKLGDPVTAAEWVAAEQAAARAAEAADAAEVAKAVADSVESAVIPKDQTEDLVIVCGVFIHWLAEDDKKIYDNNYKATLDSITNAMHGKPTADEMIAGKDAAHPFRGF